MKSTKTMLIAALAACALITGGSSLLAQNSTNPPSAGGPPGGGMRGRGPSLEQLSKDLDLTDDQKTKVKAALDALKQEITELRADTSLSQEDRRAKMKTIRDEFTAKLKDILTPDQFAKWQKMSQHMHHMPPGVENGGGTPPPVAPPQT
jgi:periplasmic protein CpxP/Spy